MLFGNGLTKVYDATRLFNYKEYLPLKKMKLFKTAKAENGNVVWLDGFMVPFSKLYHQSIPTRNIYFSISSGVIKADH